MLIGDLPSCDRDGVRVVRGDLLLWRRRDRALASRQLHAHAAPSARGTISGNFQVSRIAGQDSTSRLTANLWAVPGALQTSAVMLPTGSSKIS